MLEQAHCRSSFLPWFGDFFVDILCSFCCTILGQPFSTAPILLPGAPILLPSAPIVLPAAAILATAILAAAILAAPILLPAAPILLRAAAILVAPILGALILLTGQNRCFLCTA